MAKSEGWPVAMSRLAYVHLLRVPLLVCAALAAFTFVCFHPDLPGYWLLHGIFDVSPGALFVVAIQAALLAASLTVLTDLVIRHGPARFGIPPLRERAQAAIWNVGPFAVRRVTARFLVAYALLALFVVACATFTSGLAGHREAFVVLAGFVVAGVALFGGVRLFREPPKLLTTAFARLARWAGPGGYLDEEGRLLPGHATATLCFGVSAVRYLLFSFWIDAATLVSILNLAFLVTFLLAGLAFLLDAFRFPMLLVLGLYLAVTAQFERADHAFRTREASATVRSALGPREVLEAGARRSGDPDRAIVVCAEGGGIHTGAWAAQVLTGLEEATDGAFSPRVRLVSSTSGGSYGTLFYTASFAGGRLGGGPGVLAGIRDSTLASSLDEVASDLVYRDVWRLLFPPFVGRHRGRGEASERAWQDLSKRPAAPPSEATLATWREDARGGLRPAHVFNATVAETGERFLLSTVDLAQPQAGRREFATSFPERDVSPVTAARLSSAFPYVGPAARIDVHERDGKAPIHLVDGGYYDNFGVVSAVDFLREATAAGPPPVRHVLLVEITAFAKETDPNLERKTTSARGWFYQAFAPFQAVLAVRQTAQRSRNEIELGLLEEVLARRGVCLRKVRFAFPEDAEPESWHLTKQEKDLIEEKWADQDIQAGMNEVREFLRSEPPCPSGRAK